VDTAPVDITMNSVQQQRPCYDRHAPAGLLCLARVCYPLRTRY